MSEGKGFWINSGTGKCFEVIDHALALRSSKDAKKYGLSPAAIKKIGQITKNKLPRAEKRRRLLLTAMDEGFVRVRQHRWYVVLEFTCSTSQALPAIFTLLKESQLYRHQDNLRLTDLRTQVMVDIPWKEFRDKIQGGEHLNKSIAEIFPENIIQFPDLADVNGGEYVPSW